MSHVAFGHLVLAHLPLAKLALACLAVAMFASANLAFATFVSGNYELCFRLWGLGTLMGRLGEHNGTGGRREVDLVH